MSVSSSDGVKSVGVDGEKSIAGREGVGLTPALAAAIGTLETRGVDVMVFSVGRETVVVIVVGFVTAVVEVVLRTVVVGEMLREMFRYAFTSSAFSFFQMQCEA